MFIYILIEKLYVKQNILIECIVLKIGQYKSLKIILETMASELNIISIGAHKKSVYIPLQVIYITAVEYSLMI